MMIRALRIRFNSSIYKSARCCVCQRVRRQHSEIEWIMTILAHLFRAKYLALKRGGHNSKKNTTRESANTHLLGLLIFLSSMITFLIDSFFFASKPLSLRLFSAAFVKNNLVCKLVSLVFSRSVQRDTRREEEEEEGRRGRRVLWWWFPSCSFRTTSRRNVVYIERGNFFARVSQTYISSAIESKLLRANTCNTCETRT